MRAGLGNRQGLVLGVHGLRSHADQLLLQTNNVRLGIQQSRLQVRFTRRVLVELSEKL